MLTALLYVSLAASPEFIPVQRPAAVPDAPIAEGPQPDAEPAPEAVPTNANGMQPAPEPVALGAGDLAGPAPSVFEPVGNPPPADDVRVREPPLEWASGLLGHPGLTRPR